MEIRTAALRASLAAGRVLVAYEGDALAGWMRAQGHGRVMTSTQANECAQHVYRRLGYADVGAFALPGDSLELVLAKDLRRR